MRTSCMYRYGKRINWRKHYSFLNGNVGWRWRQESNLTLNTFLSLQFHKIATRFETSDVVFKKCVKPFICSNGFEFGRMT